MRVNRKFLLLTLSLLVAPALRAEYVVLRSGQRLTVTGYQLIGDKYRLQMNGGFVEIPRAEVVAIEPEEVFTPIVVPIVPGALAQNAQFGQFIQSAATRFHVDADLISSVIAIESNFNPKAVSRRNARGLMQLIPERQIGWACATFSIPLKILTQAHAISANCCTATITI